MAQITLTIPSDKLDKWIETAKWLWTIPQIEDPDWVAPEEFNEVEASAAQIPLVNEFTDNEWAKEGLRRHLVNQVRRHEDFLAKRALADIPAEDGLFS